MPDIPPPLSEIAYFAQHLTTIEFVWFLAWNIADGRWTEMGLDETAGRGQLLYHFSQLHDDGELLDVVKKSSGRLQRRLMALQRGTFEEIQREAPFSRHAQRNMETLLRAWQEEGEAGFAQAWVKTFPVGWEGAREPEEPIRIVGDGGDSQERALDVVGAPDQETRVAAEWWYKDYTFGQEWRSGLHLTTRPEENGTRYSAHELEIPPGGKKWIYFRLPW
jgi:hypothetical protein